MGKKKAKKLVDWQEEQRKPTPAEVKKLVKKTFGSSHWKPPKKGGKR